MKLPLLLSASLLLLALAAASACSDGECSDDVSCGFAPGGAGGQGGGGGLGGAD